MSIFGKIMSSIFGKAGASPAAPSAAPASAGKPNSSPVSAPAGPAPQVDVAAILPARGRKEREARLAAVDRRSDEAA